MGRLLSFITMLLPILPSLSLMLQVTRYPTVNKKLVLPIQVAGLLDSDNPQMVRKTSLLAIHIMGQILQFVATNYGFKMFVFSHI